MNTIELEYDSAPFHPDPHPESGYRFMVYLSNELYYPTLNAAILAWAQTLMHEDKDERVYINCPFGIKQCIEELIDERKHYGEESIFFDADQRENVKKLRAELVECIALLDSIDYR